MLWRQISVPWATGRNSNSFKSAKMRAEFWWRRPFRESVFRRKMNVWTFLLETDGSTARNMPSYYGITELISSWTPIRSPFLSVDIQSKFMNYLEMVRSISSKAGTCASLASHEKMIFEKSLNGRRWTSPPICQSKTQSALTWSPPARSRVNATECMWLSTPKSTARNIAKAKCWRS